MSLASELARETSAVVRADDARHDGVIAEVADAATRVRPVRPQAGAVLGDRHWADVGGAFGARLGALVQAVPPSYGLYGLVSPGLLTRRGLLKYPPAARMRYRSQAVSSQA
jgi:hypothetical protein